MTTNERAELLREREDPQRATFLELFFDLVLIFALTRITALLVDDLTSEGQIVVLEAGKTVLLFLALWSVWSGTAWVCDTFDPRRLQIQLLVIASMFGLLLMAVAVPDAFGDRSLLFAGAYVAIHVGRGLYLVLALRGHEAQRRTARTLFWFGISAVPWIAGAVGPAGVVRGVLWTVAVAVDYVAVALRWPAPRLGRSRTSEMPVVPEHLAERYQQVTIIALGESIVVMGLVFSSGPFAAGRTAAFAVAFATTALLWRIYIHRAGARLAEAIASSANATRLARSASIAHLLMVAGIVATAVGYELVIEHPLGHTDPAWLAVILGGPALFLIAREQLHSAVSRRVVRHRLIGAVVLAAAAPVMILVPPLVVAITAALILAGDAVADMANTQWHSRGPYKPPY